MQSHTATPWSAGADAVKSRYDADGFVLMSGLIDDAVTRAAAAHLVGLPGMDGDTGALSPPDQFDAGRRLVEHFAKEDDALTACFSDAFLEAVESLVGRALTHTPTAAQSQNLLTHDRPWHMPGPHIDGIPKENRHRTFPGPYEIAFILYLSDIAPRGGGTVGWPGSHRKVRALAESDPDRYALLFDLQGSVPSLDLGEPVELLAKRGDVLFFQHLWVHGATANVQPDPRLAIRPLCSCDACNTRWYKRDGWSFWQP